MYGDKDLPEGTILHLFNVDEKYRESLHMVFCKYWDVFSGVLPICAPLNWKLGDIHLILLVEGVEQVMKSM